MANAITSWMGQPGGTWALPRVYLAMVAVAALGAVLGYLFDLLIGPLIGQSGWWLVALYAGAIAGTAAQALREFVHPLESGRYADEEAAEEAPEQSS